MRQAQTVNCEGLFWFILLGHGRLHSQRRHVPFATPSGTGTVSQTVGFVGRYWSEAVDLAGSGSTFFGITLRLQVLVQESGSGLSRAWGLVACGSMSGHLTLPAPVLVLYSVPPGQTAATATSRIESTESDQTPPNFTKTRRQPFASLLHMCLKLRASFTLPFPIAFYVS